MHTFSLREDPWPTFSFRVAYAHRIFNDATQCKSCFRIASSSACLDLSFAIASATFRYAGFSLRKRNSRRRPLCNFIMEVFDAAQMELPETGWRSTQLLSLKARPIKGLTIHTDQIIANSLCVCLNKLCHLTSENLSMGDPFAIDNSKEGLSTKHLARCTPAVAGNMEALDIHFNRSFL